MSETFLQDYRSKNKHTLNLTKTTLNRSRSKQTLTALTKLTPLNWWITLPDCLARDDSKSCGVAGWQALFLCLNRRIQAAAEHKMTAAKDESTIIAMTASLSLFLWLLLCTLTPRGFFGLKLLSTPTSGPPSGRLKSEAGGDEGKPRNHSWYELLTSAHECIKERERDKALEMLYRDNEHTVLHSHQRRMVL